MLITNINEEQSLLTRLDHLIAESEEMRVLVGFFYFWGIAALHGGLTKNKDFKLKILVGLEAEEHAGKIVEFAGDHSPETTDEERRKDFLSSLRSVMRGKEIDTQKYYERVSLFIDLVKSGQIEIKKTRDPNHAKLYHFALNKNLAKVLGKDYCWITGSSNMTRPGLLEQNELNVQLLDFGGAESKKYFDTLWETAVPLTDDPATKVKIIELVGGDESLIAAVTPFEAYALVLKSYLEHRELVNKTDSILRIFAEPKDEAGLEKYRPLSFQIDAVNQALSILREYNGVIVADVVGLGKSVVGSVLGRVNGKRGIVIAPPGLVGDYNSGTGWWGYLQDFGLNDWVAISRGKMDDVLSLVNRQRDFELVVVDEAHYSRNQDSEDYHYLSQICRGKQVLLLTATPYSNRPNDMLSLLKLFSPARQSLLTPDGNLEGLFRVYQVKYIRMDYVLNHLTDPKHADTVESHLEKLGIKLELRSANYAKIRHEVKVLCKKLAQEIRQVVEPVMIRRNRLDLKGDPDYAKEVGKHLPTMHDPVEQFYKLSPEQSAFYDLVISEYFGEDSEFTGAIYQPGAYVPDAPDSDSEDGEGGQDSASLLNTQQRNMYKFIRRLLVRRFESSFGAFAKTLDNLIRVHKNVKRLAVPAPLGKGIIVLDRALMEKLLNMENASDEEVEDFLQKQEELLDPAGDHSGHRNVQVYRVTEDFDDEGRERFNQDLQSDINLLQKVKDKVEKLDLIANDPKARELVAEIRAVLEGKHSELVSNSKEPQRKILVFTEYGDTVDHLKGYLDKEFPGQVMTIRSLSKETAATVRKNFDGSCHAGLQQDQFKVLLATDKMSEGFNLNRAGLVINYDIPWNPTRVIQRVGRINRIGTKVFDDLYLFNFFPSEQGKSLHNVRQIAANKMFMIHTSIGEDSKILDTDEEPTAAGLFEKLGRNPDTLEEESFLTQAKREWAEICDKYPAVVEKVNKLPGRVKAAEHRDSEGTYLFARKGMTLFALRHQKTDEAEDGIAQLSIQEAISEIRCPFKAKSSKDFSENFWPNYEVLQQSLSDRRHGAAPGATSLITKARNALISKIASGAGGVFAKILLDDLQNHGTLSDRTLRKIIEASGTDVKFEKAISLLKTEMGADYLAIIKDKLPPNEIVIAIEHQEI
jgi:superfamily II DNA or RNA helicase